MCVWLPCETGGQTGEQDNQGWRQPSDSIPVEALSRCPLPDCALESHFGNGAEHDQGDGNAGGSLQYSNPGDNDTNGTEGVAGGMEKMGAGSETGVGGRSTVCM